MFWIGVGSIAIAVIWVFVMSVFLVRNDFAKATLETVYPALGAILVSIALGIKSIFLDTPEPFRFRSNIVVLQDPPVARLYGLYRHNVEDRELPELGPSYTFDNLFHINALQSLNLADKHSKLMIGGGALDEGNLLLQEFEYLFFQWLAAFNRPVWLTDRVSTRGIMGGTGAYVPLVTDRETGVIELNANTFPGNELIATDPIKIQLPNGARVTLRRPSGVQSEVELETSSSKILLKLTWAGHTTIVGEASDKGVSICRKLGLDPKKNLKQDILTLEWESRLNSFTRFSRHSSLQSQWFESVKNRFISKFDVDELLKRY